MHQFRLCEKYIVITNPVATGIEMRITTCVSFLLGFQGMKDIDLFEEFKLVAREYIYYAWKSQSGALSK